MSYTATVYRIFIASPSDTIKERKAAEEAIHEWNIVNSFNKKIVLLPVLWEKNAAPSMRHSGQGEINVQLLDDADLLVGFFKTRIGAPTEHDLSGTIGEITRHIEAGKLTMLYFSTEKISHDTDLKQLAAVKELKADWHSRNMGLTADFKSATDFGRQFSKHLSIHLNKIEYNSSVEKDISQKEKLLTKNIDGSIENPDTILNLSNGEKVTLTEEAMQLLAAVYKDKKKELVYSSSKSGLYLGTNNVDFMEGANKRTQATWIDALNQLKNNGIVEDLGTSGQVYGLTKKGYSCGDMIWLGDLI